MSATPQVRITPDEYLGRDRTADFRSEYYDGFMYAMSGTHAHALIIMTLGAKLYDAVRKRNCSITSSDMRLRLSPRGLYTYPDLMVVCGKPQYVEGGMDTLINPVLIRRV